MNHRFAWGDTVDFTIGGGGKEIAIDGWTVHYKDLGGVGLGVMAHFQHSDGHWGPWLNGDYPNSTEEKGWGIGDQVKVQFSYIVIRTDSHLSYGEKNFTSPSGDSGVDLPWVDLFASGRQSSYSYSGSFSIAPPTCQMRTKDVTVQMGNDISLSTFKSVGSRSNPVSFGVSMTCPAGINKLYYRLDQAGGSEIVGDPKNGTISLSNQGGASGVGVQISNGSPETPMPIGQNTQVNQYNPDQDNQPIHIDFNARYIQTGSQVTGGEADAQAIITMSYE